jgi:hypothetical protein
MKIGIKRSVLAALPRGQHSVKVMFREGYAESSLEIKEAITFNLLGVPCTATKGMTWSDWLVASGVSTSANNFIMLGLGENPGVYFNSSYPEYDLPSAGSGADYMHEEYRIYSPNGLAVSALDVIIDKANYAREENAPV